MQFLWFLAAICCAVGVHCESSIEEDAVPIDNSTADSLGSVLGFKPCMDENCDESYVLEPQDTEAEFPSDIPVIHCIMLRPSAVRAFGDVESRFPSFSQVKYKILEEIIIYASMHSNFHVEHCTAEVALLDFVISAAKAVREDYVKAIGDTCEYTPQEISSNQEEETTTDSLSRRLGLLGTGNDPPEDAADISFVEDIPSVSDNYEVATPEHQVPDEPCLEETEKTEYPCPGDTDEYEVTDEPCLEATEKAEEPCPGVAVEHQVTDKPEKPCQETLTGVEAVKPCEEPSVEEIIAESEYGEHAAPLVGSVRGLPGLHYPNYSDVPITSFSCADKHIPGFYADLETGCQVFHVCYEHRRESFLCPVGTTFNQPILACDYWYSSNCSVAPLYYEKVDVEVYVPDEKAKVAVDLIPAVPDKDVSAPPEFQPEEKDMEVLSKFLPVKAKVVEFPTSSEAGYERQKNVEDVASEIFDKIITSASDATAKTRHAIGKIPEPTEQEYKPAFKPKVLPVFKVKPLPVAVPLTKAAVSVGKAKLIAPALAKTKLAAVMKAKLPLVGKAVVAGAALPVVAAKVAAAIPVAKIAALKASIPVVAKAKIAAAAVPVAKAAAVKVAVPAIAKAKFAAVAVPVAKAAAAVKAAVPVVAKAKFAAAAVPVAKAKVAVATKAKIAAVAVPVAKVAAVKAAVPVVAKAKFAAAAVPVAKAKVAVAAKAKIAAVAVPVAKAAAVKAAVPVAAKAKFAAAAVAKAKVAVAAKAKIAAAAVPVAKAAAVKAAMPVVAKAKFAAVAVPAAKGKVAGAAKMAFGKVVAVKTAIPVAAKAKVVAKAAIPALKAKMFASALPLAKVKFGVPVMKAKAFGVPVMKAKAFGVPVMKAKAFGVPVMKAKALGVPIVKAKLVKAAMISPLTKKALALGYMKLLKAKKLAVMG